ncbi:MAG TPA: glycosyltransferase family 4 protein [Rhizomicrobium sp.]|jgi:glycosyltransferase involved in cell wall biosynthesis|nr:glycosyltransferase family 4 protein [Rhizomicrobium sp.]
MPPTAFFEPDCAPISRPPRLLHIFPSFDIGGSQVRFATLVKRLGHLFDHTIVSLDGGWSAATLLPGDAPVTALSVSPGGRGLASRLLRIRNMLESIAPDALLTYNWGAIEWALANGGRLPHLHHEDGFGPEESARQFQRRIWTRRLALRHSSVAVPSRVLSDIATGSWGIAARKVHHIPNGIIPCDRGGIPIEKLGLEFPRDLCRIVWTGALRREKNPLRLLRAFAPLAGKAVLILVGDGPEQDAVMREAERLGVLSHLRLLGRRSDARSIVMQSDVLALSSDTEQMPFAVLEAMDAGLPVASLDVGDVREMVSDENRPFIVPRRDEALSQALAALVADPGLRAGIGSANRKRVRSVYRASDMAARYQLLIDATLAARRQLSA